MELSKIRREVWIAAAAVAFGAGSLLYPLSADHDVFVYGGGVLLRGGVLYRDVFDVNPPGVFFLFGFAQLFLGKSAIAIRMLDLIWQTLTALAVGAISYRLSRRDWIAAVAGISYLFGYFISGWWDIASSDSFISLPLTLSVLFAFRAVGDQRWQSWFSSGFFLSLAFFFKYPVGIFLPVAMTVALISSDFTGTKRSWANASKTLWGPVTMGLGFLVPVICCCVYFRAVDGWDAFVDAEFYCAPLYAWSTHRMSSSASIFSFLDRFIWSAPDRWYRLLGVICTVELVWLAWKQRLTLEHWLVIAWLFSTLVSVLLQGRFWWKTYEPLLGPSAVLAASLLPRFSPLARRVGRLAFGIGATVIAGALCLPTFGKYVDQVRPQLDVLRGQRSLQEYQGAFGDGAFSVANQFKLAEFLSANTTPDEPVYLWAYAPTVYVRADRRAASRFILDTWVYAQWSPPKYKQEFLQTIRENPPKYFIVATHDEAPDATLLRYDSAAAFDEFDALRSFVQGRYTLERNIEGFMVYARKP